MRAREHTMRPPAVRHQRPDSKEQEPTLFELVNPIEFEVPD